MHVYLSPHHDDVCFSLGHMASRTGGALINAFTVSSYTSAPIDVPADGAARITAVTELRRREDTRFASAAGLDRHDLDLAEPLVLGLGPFDLTGMRGEVTDLSGRLVPLLLELFGRCGNGQRPALYGPIGIGGHRNHLSMALAIRESYAALSPHCDLLLYEDLPYANRVTARRKGLGFMSMVYEGFELNPLAEALDPVAAARKLESAGLYASQFAEPLRLADFTPASSLAPRPHEIVWRVSAPR